MVPPIQGGIFSEVHRFIPKMPTLHITLQAENIHCVLSWFSTEQSTQMTVGSGGLSLGKPNLRSELYKLWAVLLSCSAVVSWDSRISREVQHFGCKAYNHMQNAVWDHIPILKATCRTLFFHRRNGEPNLAVTWKWTATLTLNVRLVEKTKNYRHKTCLFLQKIMSSIHSRCFFAPYSSRYLFLLSRVSNIVQTTVYKKQREAKSKCLADDLSTWADSMSNRQTWLPFKQCSPLHCRNHSRNPRRMWDIHLFRWVRLWNFMIKEVKFCSQKSWSKSLCVSESQDLVLYVQKGLILYPITVPYLLYHSYIILFPFVTRFIYKDTPWGRSSELRPQTKGRQTTTSWSPRSPLSESPGTSLC